MPNVSLLPNARYSKMQVTKMSTQRARPRQKSCTECRRRRQKCNPRKDGPCGNCLRRWPPVECIMPKQAEHSRKPKFETEIALSETQEKFEKISTSRKSKVSPVDERQYVSPYPELSESQSLAPSIRRNNILKFEGSMPSSSNSSTLSSDESEQYNDTRHPMKREQSENISPYLDVPSALFERAIRGSPRSFGGVLTAISSLNSPPIRATPYNAELFYLFHQFVIPNMVSLDGRGAIPVLFVEQMLPWMIQSPLMPNIAILMASYTQALEQRSEFWDCSETLSIKSHVLSLVNAYLRQDFDHVGGEALRAVTHLAIIEFFWGAEVSLWAHMKGIKQMIKLRGGFEGMEDPLLVQVLILTDYELACCFERDLYLQPPPTGSEELPIITSYPEKFSSPLLPFRATFKQCCDCLNLSLAAAEILDEVRLLTISITSRRTPKNSVLSIQDAASSIHQKLQRHAISVPAQDAELVYDTIRLAALIYTNCIMSAVPFCSPENEFLPQKLYKSLIKIPLSRWKDAPGIFLWILLIAAQNSGNDAKGRFLKKKMAVAGMSIGLEDFSLGIGHLRAFWEVQRWIRKQRETVNELSDE